LWCIKRDVQVCGNEADSCTLYLEFGEAAPKPMEGTPNFAQQTNGADGPAAHA
jgi:hypothetical protein